MKIILTIFHSCLTIIFATIITNAQTGNMTGKITCNGKPIEFATIVIKGTTFGTTTDKYGIYNIYNVPIGLYDVIVSCIGYETISKLATIKDKQSIYLDFAIVPSYSIINEVVITGVSKTTLIKENPLPIIAISTRQIEQTTESNIIDALSKNAPGLDAVKTGPNVSKPFINGLGYNRVLTLYDGIRVETQQWGDEHGVPIDDYNIDKAEVIKGPASLMYGSDAVAGVLSIFSPIPTGTEGIIRGKFLSEYQNNNGLIGNALSLGYCGNHWLWALRGSYRIAKNYTNPIDSRVYNTGFRTENCSGLIGYNGEKGYTHLTFTFYDNLQGIPDGSRDSISRKFTYQLNEAQGENTLLHQYDDIKNRPVVSDNSLNSYNLSTLHQHIQDYRLYLDNNYKFNDFDMKILLGFEQNARREYNHPTDFSQAGMYVILNTVNYNIRFNLPTFSNIETSIGINGMYQNNTNMDATDFPIPNYELFDAGGYGYAKWKLNKWTIGGGIRYDFRNVNGQEMYIKSNPLSGFFQHVPINDSAGGIKQFQSFQLQFQGISGSIGTTFQLNKNLSIKANIARGYRAPNITEIASNGLDPGAHIVYEGNLNFVPEFSIQEDVAVKGDFRNETIGFSIFNPKPK